MNISELFIPLTLLTVIATILSIINGLILLRNYLRDKPNLVVEIIHPDVYQWFFTLPEGTYQNNKTRKYGFLAYIDVINKGMRDVSLDSWRLHLKTKLGKWVEFKALSIPEPQLKLGQSAFMKTWPVLGQKTLHSSGDTMVKSGSVVSGFVYFIAHFYGGEGWNPFIKNGKAIGKIAIKDVFGKKNNTKISFTEIPLSQAQEMIPEIEKIDLNEAWNITQHQ